MSAPLISESDPAPLPPDPAAQAAATRTAALAANWSAADIDWELYQDEGNMFLRAGDPLRAGRLWRRAGWIALWRFPPADPRRAATLANLAWLDRQRDREPRAGRRYAKALQIWGGAQGYIDAMQILPRARSSLYHLRMQTKHWDTYQANMRKRMAAFAAETAEALAALKAGEPVRHRLYERWRAERPPVFDDTRRFLAAALLIAGGAETQAPEHITPVAEPAAPEDDPA